LINYELSTPSPEQASAILSMVPYRERLKVGRMRMPSGFMATPVRSLHEVHVTLIMDDKSMPAIYLPSLSVWVDEVVGDRELARVIDACALDEVSSYIDRCRKLHKIIGMRLTQLREIADASDF
jgi:hypothetical protein